MIDSTLNAPQVGPTTATNTPRQPVILRTSARMKPPPFTANQETDAHTAMTRGLAQYLRTLSSVFADGRDIRLVDVKETWSEPEGEAVYPSGCIYSPEKGRYDASRLTPEPSPANRIPDPDGRYVVKVAEFVQDLHGELWCTDNKQRMAVAAMVETGLTASTFMYGIELFVPHYFNSSVVYELKEMGYEDSDIAAKERIRKVSFILTGQVSVLSLRSYPGAQPRVQTDVGSQPLTGPS